VLVLRSEAPRMQILDRRKATRQPYGRRPRAGARSWVMWRRPVGDLLEGAQARTLEEFAKQLALTHAQAVAGIHDLQWLTARDKQRLQVRERGQVRDPCDVLPVACRASRDTSCQLHVILGKEQLEQESIERERRDTFTQAQDGDVSHFGGHSRKLAS
jgi:hypothetical protein